MKPWSTLYTAKQMQNVLRIWGLKDMALPGPKGQIVIAFPQGDQYRVQYPFKYGTVVRDEAKGTYGDTLYRLTLSTEAPVAPVPAAQEPAQGPLSAGEVRG